MMETQRAIMTFLKQEDFHEVLDMFHEPDTFKYITPLDKRTDQEYIEILKSRILQTSLREGFHWTARLKDTNEFIGAINLNPFPKSGKMQLGFQIRRKFWNQGYTSELAAKALKFGVEEANLKEVYGYFEKENVASGMARCHGHELDGCLQLVQSCSRVNGRRRSYRQYLFIGSGDGLFWTSQLRDSKSGDHDLHEGSQQRTVSQENSGERGSTWRC